MQQAVEAMKSSFVHNKQEGSDFDRSRRFGRRGLNVTEIKRHALETSVQRTDRPIVADMKTRPSVYLQAAAKLADSAHVLTRSKRFIGLSKPRRMTSIPLPPISRSRTVSGKVERTDALHSGKPKACTHLPTGNVLTENTVFHVLVTQGRKVNRESNKANQISVALGAGNKVAVQDPETCSRLTKQTVDGQPPATSPPIRHKTDTNGPGANDSSAMMPVRAKHDASLSKARQQRDFCSDNSAIETESEGSPDKGRLERLREGSDDDDDEYYTERRITEWVLKVNSSLFSAGNDELTRSKRAEEQDVATIKIIYSGD